LSSGTKDKKRKNSRVARLTISCPIQATTWAATWRSPSLCPSLSTPIYPSLSTLHKGSCKVGGAKGTWRLGVRDWLRSQKDMSQRILRMSSVRGRGIKSSSWAWVINSRPSLNSPLPLRIPHWFKTVSQQCMQNMQVLKVCLKIITH